MVSQSSLFFNSLVLLLVQRILFFQYVLLLIVRKYFKGPGR